MTDRHSLRKKQEIYDQWFEKDNIIKKPLDGLLRMNSVVDDYIEKNNKLIFEILELDGPDLIRLAIGRNCDCTCRSFLADDEDLIHLKDLLDEYFKNKMRHIGNFMDYKSPVKG